MNKNQKKINNFEKMEYFEILEDDRRTNGKRGKQITENHLIEGEFRIGKKEYRHRSKNKTKR